jgi:hypothetical protein
LCHIYAIILGCIREIVCGIEEWELTLRHTHLLTDIIDRISEYNSMDIIYILRGKVHHAACDIPRIFTTSEHATYPVYSSIAVRVTEALMHCRYESIVFFTILIVVE